MKEKIYKSSDEFLEKHGGNGLIFVSGVFDVLHIGHLDFFRNSKQKAKELSKNDPKLVIVIHDDKSVKKHKGENRPVNNLESRMRFLSELELVDYVVPWFGWEDVQEFFKKLKPEFIALSRSQFEHKTVREVAESVGSTIIVNEYSPGYSTSEILKSFGY